MKVLIAVRRPIHHTQPLRIERGSEIPTCPVSITVAPGDFIDVFLLDAEAVFEVSERTP